MYDYLLKLIKDIQLDKRLLSFDEAATKQAVILRILNCLEWNSFDIDEVHPEYSVRGKRVDYSLRYNSLNKVFIEVKKVGEELEKHQEQLLNYSFNEGVKLAILTNGITWWFYLPLNEGSWEQRKYYTIEIYDQKDEEITQRFIDFLSKQFVVSGKAIENAENIYRSIQKQDIIKVTLPKAWTKIIKEDNPELIEMIAESTEKMCGYKPDQSTVIQFINNINKYNINDHIIKNEKQNDIESLLKYQKPYIQKEFTNKNITSFSFNGEKYIINKWKDILTHISAIILNESNDTDRILTLRGKKRPYFTKDPDKLRAPFQVKGTDVFVETNLSANDIVKISKKLIVLYGYNENSIKIEVT